MYNQNYSNTVFQVNKQSIVTILWLYIKVIDLFHIITEYWVIDNKTVTSVLYTKDKQVFKMEYQIYTD